MAAKVLSAPLHSTPTRRSRSRSRSIIRSRSRSKSRQQAQQQTQSIKKKTTQKKLLNVHVQILSVAGVHIEDTSNAKKSSFLRKSTTTTNAETTNNSNTTDNSATNIRGRSRSRTRSLSRSRSKSRGRSLSRNRRRSSSLASPTRTRGRSTRRVTIAPESDPTAITIVSSFERTSTFIQGGKKVGPKKITTSCISLPFNPADNEGESENKSSSQVIPWGDQSKSSFTFQRYFRHESTSSSTSTKSFDPLGISKQQRYQPIICPIQLSLSRNGKMYQLGTASIYISGEEAGVSSMNVPITTTTTSPVTSPFKKSNNNNVAMKSIKGERNLKYGISTKATLRIVVTVSDPSSTLERISKALSFDNKQKEEEENKKVVRIKEPTFLEFLCCMG